jgi:hypothetical protein
MKLTKAQWALLVDIVNGDARCHPDYKPAKKLVELRLATCEHGDLLVPTEAGRAALSCLKQEDRP